MPFQPIIIENETLLQKEIERLNCIINLLIEKNRELERKLQSAFLQITSTDRPFLAHTQEGDIIVRTAYQYEFTESALVIIRHTIH